MILCWRILDIVGGFWLDVVLVVLVGVDDEGDGVVVDEGDFYVGVEFVVGDGVVEF